MHFGYRFAHANTPTCIVQMFAYRACTLENVGRILETYKENAVLEHISSDNWKAFSCRSSKLPYVHVLCVCASIYTQYTPVCAKMQSLSTDANCIWNRQISQDEGIKFRKLICILGSSQYIAYIQAHATSCMAGRHFAQYPINSPIQFLSVWLS